MARLNSQAVEYCLLIFASVVLFSFALVNRHVKFTHWTHGRPHPLLRLQSTASPQKSPESNFFSAIPQKNTTSSSDGIPAIHQLDRDAGPLPPGAYRSADIDDGQDVIAPCLIAVGIQPTSNANDGKDVWREGVKNSQKLIDAGFNAFRVNNCYERHKKIKGYDGNKRRKSPSSIAWETVQQRTLRTEIRHESETNFYQTLRQNTPSSVLRSCHFMVNLEIPSILSVDMPGVDKDMSAVPFGNGWMVRESVSNALLRTKGECLDSVILEYRENSPYHLDVLDTLFEMKRDGLVQSISTKNFPPSLLRSALGCGFNVHSNDVLGNLMNTNNLQPKSELGVLCNDHGFSRLVSAPLGRGLFTNQYCQFQEWGQLSASSKKMFNTLFDSCCKMHTGPGFDSEQKWKRYRTIMDTLESAAFKYQVSVESIALRWLLQLNHGDSISVGTHLGMDFIEDQGGQQYSRYRDLRQVFTFSLEEDDMERLCRVSGFTSDRHLQSGQSGMGADHEIDFTNKALWV
mmetsp:Transcript_21729/g.47215  ORF Transcript_21729/g.47215 Transcript_21729/m.47215 type:complete len:515 (+) Transcript_21729:95-1639(+)